MSREPLKTVVRYRFKRRDLLKAAPLVGAAAGVAGLALVGQQATASVQNKGTCRFCLMHCGVLGTVQGDRLVKVEGDLTSRTRGFVCLHGYALREMVHSASRVRRPLMRRGDAFHELSWPDALGEIAQRLQKVKAQHGPEAFLIQTGWPLVRHPLVNVLHRFARAFGSPHVSSVASLCEASLRMGQSLVVGTKYSPALKQVRTMAVWGINPPVTAPPFAHVVAQKAQSGNLIVIDPVRTQLAAEATEWLRIRPGTDGALALGLINVVLSEGLYDADFMSRHTVGLEPLRTLAAQYPLERVEQLTSVPRAQALKVARLLGTEGPVGIWQGLGVEHHENGVQTSRAITALEVLCGRFDGTQDKRTLVAPMPPDFREVMLPALYDLHTPVPAPPPITAKALGRDEFPLYEMYNREAQGQLLPDAIENPKPGTPPIRAVMLMASNALLTSSDSGRLQEAAKKLDLLVTVDPFLSFSAQRSDFVLPSATFAEAPDVDDRDTVQSESIVAPQHEAWPDFRIVTHLARALGLGQYFPWDDFHAYATAPQVRFMEDAASQPHPVPETDQPRFGTLSGQAEFESRLLPKYGHDALPVWTPPTQATSDEFPLRLVTGPRPRAFINSQFHGVPSIEARLREPEALVHFEVATKLGLTHGKRVAIVSPVGRAEARLVVTDGLHPEVVVLPAGWPDLDVNRLTDGSKRDPISGFPAFRSGVCRVEKLA